ncbi:unnamed protein product [Eruca vesicaria subsp. sativa]|uniref:Phytocyanin domain-containing protein n=1 Tax=Eruca vesicaria subsp. sativa TaxID=29727 RepID=A0ABC8L484_ERUVS|nr:unnamed protein product [Eruca vesicaria subsp. sativa]
MGIIVPVLTLVFLLLTTVSHAASKPRMILVGGSAQAWKVPDSSTNTLNQWAENNRFKVGDILVWKYDGKVDSVLKVTKEDYDTCNTANPLKQFNDGDTEIELENSGAHFFISGAPDHCAKGEKIHIVVLAERNPGGGGSRDGGDGGSPMVTPVSPQAKTPASAPAHNAAVGLNVGSGLFLTAVAIGLAMA